MSLFKGDGNSSRGEEEWSWTVGREEFRCVVISD